MPIILHAEVQTTEIIEYAYLDSWGESASVNGVEEELRLPIMETRKLL
jgi:hypothetical protein